jgi:hypothetical protein
MAVVRGTVLGTLLGIELAGRLHTEEWLQAYPLAKLLAAVTEVPSSVELVIYYHRTVQEDYAAKSMPNSNASELHDVDVVAAAAVAVAVASAVIALVAAHSDVLLHELHSLQGVRHVALLTPPAATSRALAFAVERASWVAAAAAAAAAAVVVVAAIVVLHGRYIAVVAPRCCAASWVVDSPTPHANELSAIAGTAVLH